MPVPFVFTDINNPPIVSAQVNANFAWLDNGGKYREALVPGVLCDGSVTAVSFNPAFASSLGPINLTVSNVSTDGSGPPYYAVTARVVGTPTLTGCNIFCEGAPPGSTCTINLRASGA